MLIFALLISFLLTLLGLALSDYFQEKISDSIKYRMKNKKQLFKANVIYKKYVKDITIITISITKDNYFDIISLQLKTTDVNITDNFDLELFIDDFEPIHSSWLFFKNKPNYVKKIVINNQVGGVIL
jgi:hypothetical protein